MIDISNLSYDELTELEKTIRKQKEYVRQQNIKKEEIEKEIGTKFAYIFTGRYPKETYSNNYHHGLVSDLAFDSWSKTSDSVFKLCDIALRNYYENKEVIRMRSAVPKKKEHDYIAMYNDIMKVFCRYAEKIDSVRGES